MDEKIKKHLENYCKSKGWGTSENDLIEALTCKDIVFSKEIERHRWLTEYLYVADIDGMLIGYYNARSDDGEDRGYEFDASAIHEVEKKEVVVVDYVPKN